jgi:hypothetical protein
MRRPLRAIAATTAALVATLIFAATAAFATETETVHFSGSDTTPDVNPCSGATGMLTFDFRGVSHITTLDNGTSHETTTATGTFTFVPDDASQPTYSGHATFWDGENVNSKTFTATFTGNIVLQGSDGSRLTEHAIFHITVNPDGTVTSSIDKDTLTCP